jgi:prepilin peptidase CpaA
MPTTATIMLVVLVCLAGWYDLRYRKIPNWLNLSGVVFALSTAALQSGFNGLKIAALGGLCAIAVYFPLYLLRGMGAGDVKLMAAIGALTGPGNWFTIFLLTAVLGGLSALTLVVYRRAGRQTLCNLGTILRELVHGRAPVHRAPELDIRNQRALRLPHGAVIAAGALLFTVFLRF